MVEYVLLCIGGMILGAAFLIFLWNLSLLLRYESAEGTIIEETSSGSDDDTGTHAVVQFKTRDGQLVKFKDSAYFGFFLSAISDFYSINILKKDPSKVTVIYSPNNPKRARIKNFLRLHYGSFLLTVIGLVVLVSGLAPDNFFRRALDFLSNLPF